MLRFKFKIVGGRWRRHSGHDHITSGIFKNIAVNAMFACGKFRRFENPSLLDLLPHLYIIINIQTDTILCHFKLVLTKKDTWSSGSWTQRRQISDNGHKPRLWLSWDTLPDEIQQYQEEECCENLSVTEINGEIPCQGEGSGKDLKNPCKDYAGTYWGTQCSHTRLDELLQPHKCKQTIQHTLQVHRMESLQILLQHAQDSQSIRR